MGDLQQDAHAVSGLSGGVPARPVAELFHDRERVAHSLVAPSALKVNDGPDAAGVVLKAGVVKRILLSVFHTFTHQFHRYEKGKPSRTSPGTCLLFQFTAV